MATGMSQAYDSDQESIEMNDLPWFGVENIESSDVESLTSGMGIASLVDYEHAEIKTNERMEEIAKELQLFTLEKSTEESFPFEPMQDRYVELQPPGVPFFTLKSDTIYSEDTLLWPFKNIKDMKEPLRDFSFSKIKKHILEGYFKRYYMSRKKSTKLVKYLFHIFCCTKDVKLMHFSFITACYVLQAHSLNIDLLDDLLLALANLGGNITKLDKNVANISSPVIQHQNKTEAGFETVTEHSQTLFKENKILILEFIALHLTKNKKYSASDLEDLIKIVLAVALDPLMIYSGASSHVAKSIDLILSMYPSNQNFSERILSLVEHITVYCEFHHHTVAYLCCYYILSGHCQSKILRSSLAYLQAEISLQKEKKDILEFVEVVDVLDLVTEQLYVFSKETDTYLLHSVLLLLDVCIGDDPLGAEQQKLLQKVIDQLEPVIQRRKKLVNDDYTSFLHTLKDWLMMKWRRKAGTVNVNQHQVVTDGSSERPADNVLAAEGMTADTTLEDQLTGEHVKRKQTLIELQSSSVSSSQSPTSSGPDTI